MRPKLKIVSEEIVRWAFEVAVTSQPKWKIAFTNPTAGPWKRIMAQDKSGRSGEVHRFQIDEKRPDLILYSDEFKVVLIIEAKTELGGLSDSSQVKKTTELFANLVGLLSSKSDNIFWAGRANYTYELGLLWGKQKESDSDILRVAVTYVNECKGRIKDVICIQGELKAKNLSHRLFWGSAGTDLGLDTFRVES